MNLLKAGGRISGVLTVLLLGMASAPIHASTIKQPMESTLLVAGADMYLADFSRSTPRTPAFESHDQKWTSRHDAHDFSLADETRGLPSFIDSKRTGKHHWMFDGETPDAYHGNNFLKSWARNRAGRHHKDFDCPPVTPVPLPGAAWLLISGIASLVVFRSKRQLSGN